MVGEEETAKVKAEKLAAAKKRVSGSDSVIFPSLEYAMVDASFPISLSN